ncbi:acyltransferase [Psychrobacillus sp. OK028]|uniref:acyltransferase n=1 Tax=Psychrobacillus sp. OK028 TaxID=1884359 RepID=UPI000B80D81D|nr:acyltransferase [Psychrobacillus sp. OK028]
MQPDFSLQLDQIFGPRQIFHVMECYTCGYNEYYFQHPKTKKQIGVVCEGCNYICSFEEHME